MADKLGFTSHCVSEPPNSKETEMTAEKEINEKTELAMLRGLVHAVSAEGW